LLHKHGTRARCSPKHILFPVACNLVKAVRKAVHIGVWPYWSSSLGRRRRRIPLDVPMNIGKRRKPAGARVMVRSIYGIRYLDLRAKSCNRTCKNVPPNFFIRSQSNFSMKRGSFGSTALAILEQLVTAVLRYRSVYAF
jgi:hypothetical protein